MTAYSEVRRSLGLRHVIIYAVAAWLVARVGGPGSLADQ